LAQVSSYGMLQSQSDCSPY